MRLVARYFDGKTSAAQRAELALLDNGHFHLIANGMERWCTLAEVQISHRVGNTQRRLRFADGASCELDDNDALDAWLKQQHTHHLARGLFGLEQKWSLAILSLGAIVALSWGFLRYGVPVLANQVAMRLPISMDDRLGSDSLALLDKSMFAASELSPERQDALRQDFQKIIAGLPNSQRYRLEFRHGGKQIGANAFALPSGVIVMTDELVTLSKDPNEIVAVLAHEVGHVVHRHATRMILQSSASAVLLFTLLGDVSSVSSLAASAPALLTQARYSREFETEADDYSYAWLKQHGIATHYFGDLLLRLEKDHGGNDALSYFASHPRTEQRLRN